MGRVRSGLEELLARPGRLRGVRVGLIANPTTVTPDLVHASLALKQSRAFRLTALFGPEHGIWADAQDLVEVEDSRDPTTGLPVFSLYGKTRIPTAEMLSGVDALLFDVQDVGARYYTFIYTMLHALQACARYRRRLVVLDRPNPLGGTALEGNVLEPEYLSFVGMHPLPPRHAMTVGELALLFREELGLDADLQVVRMRGWRREMAFEETGLPWVMPSPNMPTVDTAWVYPGGCLVEGTNLSEGRGTTRPFELVGAPWLDPWRLASDLEKECLPGVRFRPVSFTPTFSKHAGALCHGVQVHVFERARLRAFETGLHLIDALIRQNPSAFEFLPGSWEGRAPHFDLLCGVADLRPMLLARTPVAEIARSWQEPSSAQREAMRMFMRRRKQYLRYD